MKTLDVYFKKAPKPSEVLKKSFTTLTVAEETQVSKNLFVIENKKPSTSRRSKYRKWKGNERAEVGEYTYRHGVSASVKHIEVPMIFVLFLYQFFVVGRLNYFCHT